MRDNEISQLDQAEVAQNFYAPDELGAFLEHTYQSFPKYSSYKDSKGRTAEAAYYHAYDAAVRGLIDLLVKEQDRFKHIFQTDQGSMYFILSTGHSQRIKAEDGKFGPGSRQFMTKEIFFISPVEQERISNIVREAPERRYGALLGKQIHTISLSVGSHPVELNINGYNPVFDVRLDRKEGAIIMNGARNEWDDPNREPQISNGIHIGHPVVKIYK
jgi:hypothetical protein